LKTNSFGKLIV